MEFSRQEYWRGLPFPSPGDLPNPGGEPGCPALEADATLSELPGKSIVVHCQSITPALINRQPLPPHNCVACGILVPHPGNQPAFPEVERQNLNQRMAREVPNLTTCDDY